MPIKSFAEQVAEHLEFLQQRGLAVAELAIDAGFVRCRAVDENEGSRGEYAYQTRRNLMDKPGTVGLVTWCRGPGGHHTHKTYGLDGDGDAFAAAQPLPPAAQEAESQDDIADKCHYLLGPSFPLWSI